MDRAITPNMQFDTFQHEPLPDAARYIRLLEVLDDNCSETIKVRCKLTTWLFEDVPPYHAISYTWGDPESDATILINNYTLKVRTNCELVLKQACWYKKRQYYWVDAICIDQTNSTEKSIQVSLMGKIYQQASHVLASVGEHADDSRFIFGKFQQIFATSLKVDGRICIMFNMAEDFAIIRRFLWAAIDFTQRPYFTRLWILQEQKLAKRITFLCGKDAVTRQHVRNITLIALLYCQEMRMGRISIERSVRGGHLAARNPALRIWRLLLKWRHLAAHNLAPRIWRLFLLPTQLLPMPERHGLPRSSEDTKALLRRVWMTENFLSAVSSKLDSEVSTLLETTSGLQCSDNKDKIYGMISLFNWGPSGPVKPDYTKTDFEVALDFVLAISELEEYREFEPLATVTRLTCRNLGLNCESDGAFNAVEARRGRPTIAAAKLKASTTETITLRGPGLVVQHDDLSENPGYTTWSSSTWNGLKVYLPPWVKHGDIIVPSEDLDGTVRHPVAVRLLPSDSTSRNAERRESALIIGHGFCENWGSSKIFIDMRVPDAQICWDIEDVVIFQLVAERLSSSKKFSPEWISALNTGICRKATPLSSYVAVEFPVG